jgi:hypothetical protein
MARPKGSPKFGGRAKGTPNKATREARVAISEFVQGNVGRLQEWLDEVAKENPERAFMMVQNLIEFHVPKMSRLEIEGEGLPSIDAALALAAARVASLDKQQAEAIQGEAVRLDDE